MFCTKCGAKMAEGAKFCGSCANPLDTTTFGQQDPKPFSSFPADEQASPFEPQEPVFEQTAGIPKRSEGPERQGHSHADAAWGTQPFQQPSQGPQNSQYSPYPPPVGQNSGYQNPYGYQQPWNMPPQPPKKSKKGLIIAISITVTVILLVVAVIWAYGAFVAKPHYSQLKMASGIDQQTSKPVTLTDVFTPDTPVIYLTGIINSAREGTRIKGVWRHIDTGDQVEGQELQVRGSYWFNFHLPAPEGGFPTGRYEIIMYINDEEVDRVAFKVEGSGSADAQEQTTQPEQENTEQTAEIPQVSLSNLTPTSAVNDKSEPTEATDTFQGDIPAIYIAGMVNNAVSGTKLKAVWTHEESNSSVESPELNVDGTRWFNFYLTKPETAFPAGNYQVVLTIDGKEAGRVKFKVAAAADTSQSSEANASGDITITELGTYSGVDSEGKPRDAKSTFKTKDAAVYVVGIINNAPKDTKLKAVWFHNNSGQNVEAPTLTVEGSRWFNFYLKKPEQGFTPGSYLVKLYVNDTETTEITFEIK